MKIAEDGRIRIVIEVTDEESGDLITKVVRGYEIRNASLQAMLDRTCIAVTDNVKQLTDTLSFIVDDVEDHRPGGLVDG